MIKACVIGYPIKHSRSPLIHTFWLEYYGIGGSYERQEIEPTRLKSFFAELTAGTYAGCNITLPHKEAACAHVHYLDDRAMRAGSINTVYVRGQEIHATTTDGQGFVQNIRWRAPQFEFDGKTVMILGAGGSARAIIDELLRSGVEKIILANRTIAKAQSIAISFDHRLQPIPLPELDNHLPDIDLLINTTSAGIANSGSLDIPFSRLRHTALVTDINYVPLVTPFLQQALSHGFRTVSGLGMLLHQAVPGFELWFGQRPIVTDELHDMVARDIDPAYQP